jgi:metallo-beta-lactamase family protein
MTTQPLPSSGISVTFWGAARTVTGSMHLVEANGFRFLLDCGLYQGHRDEAFERNHNFPFQPHAIQAVVLSHAHLDHCGNLPSLVKQGFHGPIYCTPATRDLMAIMLADSAKIQEEDADFLNRHRDQHQPRVEPLYTRPDARRTLHFARSLPYEQPQEIAPGIQVRFVDAGHLLGSAMVALRLQVGGRARTITFTGDLGRRGVPILRDPAPVPPAELLISESTYGGRRHPPADLLEESLGNVVRRTAERGGKLLVPAFSLGRSQLLVFLLNELLQAGTIPELPIFVDSPLAAEATEVYRLHPECFDEETAQLLEERPDLFGKGRVQYTRTVQESKKLNGRRDPCIIIAGSGMCESGRIQHHLKHNVEDARNTILIVGYQAPDTLGKRIVDRQPRLRIHDQFFNLRAEVVVMNGASSHADREDFLAFLGPLANQTKSVRLVHGDLDQSTALAQLLAEHGFKDVAIPERGSTFVMDEPV